MVEPESALVFYHFWLLIQQPKPPPLTSVVPLDEPLERPDALAIRRAAFCGTSGLSILVSLNTAKNTNCTWTWSVTFRMNIL